jgi:hypothetical protein
MDCQAESVGAYYGSSCFFCFTVSIKENENGQRPYRRSCWPFTLREETFGYA